MNRKPTKDQLLEMKLLQSLRYPFLCRHYNVFGNCVRNEKTEPCQADEGEPCEHFRRKNRTETPR